MISEWKNARARRPRHDSAATGNRSGLLRIVVLSAFLASYSWATARAASGQQAPAAGTGSGSQETTHWLDISIEHRTRYESLDHRFRLGTSGSDQEIAQRTRVRFEIRKIVDRVGLLMEFEDARVHLDDSRTMITNNYVNENDILQLYAAVRLSRAPETKHPSTLFIGRSSFDLGSRRLFARNRFRNTTNAFEGIRWSLAGEKRWALDTFLFQPVRRRMHRPDTRNHGSYFWGAFLTRAFKPKVQSELYYFGIHESPAAAQSQKRRFSTIGARLYRNPAPGAVSYDLEAAGQYGKVAALDHRAYFVHAQADYTVDTRWRPRLTARYDYASGDHNPYDQKDGTFDSLYGARSWEYGPTGIYGPWPRSNLNSPGWALELNPSRRMTIAHSMRWVWLAQARDSWQGTGLRDVTGKAGTFVGRQFEMILRYNFGEHFQPAIGYVRLLKGSYLERVPKSPGAMDSNYFYVELNFKFDHVLR